MRKQVGYTLALLAVFLITQNTRAQNSPPYQSLAGNSNATFFKLSITNAINLNTRITYPLPTGIVETKKRTAVR